MGSGVPACSRLDSLECGVSGTSHLLVVDVGMSDPIKSGFPNLRRIVVAIGITMMLVDVVLTIGLSAYAATWDRMTTRFFEGIGLCVAAYWSWGMTDRSDADA